MSETPGPQEYAGTPEEERRLRREAEEALRQAREWNRLLTESVKDFAIYALDPAGRITSWNEGARRLLGYTPEEAVGLDGSVVFTEEDRRAGRPPRELREAEVAGSAADDNWAVRKDGTRFWASGFTSALRDDVGGLRGFLKICRDLTDRRAAEQALAESDARLRAALSAARMGTWLWEIPADRDHLDDNLRELLGLPVGASVETLDDFLHVLHPDDRAGVAEAFRRSAELGETINVEFRVVRPDGSIRWIRDQGDVSRDAQGRPLALAGACVDITDRKEMEEALRQARDGLERRVEERTAELRRAQERALQSERLAAVGQTVAVLAHDGRNALQRTLACLERLGWRLQDRPEALALVRHAEKAQEDLRRLFDDLRGYAAPVLLERRPCDVARVWREAWTDALAEHPGRDARLSEQTGGSDLTCEADAFRLRQVFRNIFDNAMVACPDPVRVQVVCGETALEERPALRVAVRDNGPGLSAEQKLRLFEPFYTTKARGTGLGMAIARRVVEAHGGQIAVGDDAGPGAEIVVTLPRTKD